MNLYDNVWYSKRVMNYVTIIHDDCSCHMRVLPEACLMSLLKRLQLLPVVRHDPEDGVKLNVVFVSVVQVLYFML